MEQQRADALATYLNALEFVRWDRCTIDANENVIVYGWIDTNHACACGRPDGRADFVMLEFTAAGQLGYTTSSPTHSRLIGERLGFDGADHADCQRVLDVFGPQLKRTVAHV